MELFKHSLLLMLKAQYLPVIYWWPVVAVAGNNDDDDLMAALPAGQRPPAAVIVSAREVDAVRAFELRATDFVMAPVDAARFRSALVRARNQVRQLAVLRTADDGRRAHPGLGPAGGAAALILNLKDRAAPSPPGS